MASRRLEQLDSSDPDAGDPLPVAGPPDPALEVARSATRRVPWEAFLLGRLPGGECEPTAGREAPPPSAVEAMVAALELAPGDRVLHIGAGTGYVTAVLAQVAAEVYAIERQGALVERARAHFRALGLERVQLLQGEAPTLWHDRGPFEGILVTLRGAEINPLPLLEQLAVGGRLVLVTGKQRDRQPLLRFRHQEGDRFVRERLQDVRVVSRIGDILVETGVAGREEVERAARAARAAGHRLGEELSKLAHLEEADLYRALALQRGLRFEPVDGLLRDADVRLLRSIPRPFLEHNQVIPLARCGRTLRVATSNPEASPTALEAVFPDAALELYLVTPTDYRRLWGALELMEERDALEHEPARAADVDLMTATSPLDAHNIALFDALLLDAISGRASDIHLEVYGEKVRLRLRVDGELMDLERYQLSTTELVGLINVIKIRANLDIAERRLPQGGRIRLRAGGHAYDLRVQTQPSLHGEHAVIRLLPQDAQVLTIEDLGFSPTIADHYRRLLDNPAGLILVVGPTGSGKSTTLYAGLQLLAADASRKVITVEDPVEYSIERVQQTQVRAGIGFGFADAVRSFVRQDPDVILVGEIRDAETALEAIRASQTGHVVLTTLHCNDAVDAVQRLFDLGMHPNSIASELLAVFAQRLARRICEGCRQPAEPEPTIVAELFPPELFPAGPPPDFRCFRGAGCRRCDGRGTRGRIAVLEFLRANPAVRGAISRQPPLDELRAVALQAGLIAMRENALEHVRAGTIPLAELRNVLTAERMAPEGAALAACGCGCPLPPPRELDIGPGEAG